METTSLKILSYNIHKGFTSPHRKFILSAIRTALHATNVDLLFLQEVIGEDLHKAKKFFDWPTMSQYEYLADQVWPHHRYGKNAVFDGGHHGNAILSRYPFVSWTNYNISTNRFERRGLLLGVIDIREINMKLNVACIHFGLTRKGRKLQLKKTCDIIQEHVPSDAPLILAGDFNDWEKQASSALKEKLNLVEVVEHFKGRPAATFPAFFPFVPLDRIYVRGLLIQQAEALHGKLWSDLSDHTPICAEVSLIESVQ